MRLLTLFLVLCCVCLCVSAYDSWESWLFDQQDTSPEGGGMVYIFDKSSYSSNNRVVSIDLAKEANASGCPIGKRPHMGASFPVPGASNPTPNMTHYVIGYLASGDIQVVDIRSRKVVGCVRTRDGFNQGGGSVAMHAIHIEQYAPGKGYIIGYDMGAAGASGYLHKIDADFTTNSYRLIETHSLSQYESQIGENKRVRPVCGTRDPVKGYNYVSCQQGGLLVVDFGTATTPISVKHVYDAATVPGSGVCAGIGIYTDDHMVITNSENTTVEVGVDILSDYLYIWPNGLLSENVYADPVRLDLAGQDSHGGTLCISKDKKRYLWNFMRLSGDVHIIDLDVNKVVKTLTLNASWVVNPTPDLVSTEVGVREGTWEIWGALRGSNPLSGVPTAINPNRVGGAMVLHVKDSCLDFSWESKDFFSANLNMTIGASDTHAITKIYLHNASPVESDSDVDDSDSSSGSTYSSFLSVY
eukprot:TRINITY_DN7066_c0_g1_i1.p1 TRINITY_DN7066_c0_g1~~TRINITY_DN7066_c0_g1_i1.p1  ORF type:complete len:471 (+),score=75.77 TRINITY_DN7066_c0_g1_i1:57-1469(+)